MTATATGERIRELEARRETIAGELEGARSAVGEARGAVIGGHASTETLTAPQGRVLALEAAVSELDAELDRLRAEEAIEGAAAERAELIRRAAEAATVATAARVEAEEARATADRQLREQAARILDALREHEAARRRFRDAVAALTGAPLHLEGSRIRVDPELREAVDALVAELEAEGADLEAVRMALTGRGDLYLDRAPKLAELPTGELIAGAARVVERLEQRGQG